MASVHTTTVSQPICVSIQQIVADTTNMPHRHASLSLSAKKVQCCVVNNIWKHH